MSSHLKKYGYLTAVAVLAFASASFAGTTSMDLTGTGDNATVWDGGMGAYVDPYTATVGGVANTSVICDDWSNNSYVNETWTATVTTVSSLASGPSSAVMFGANSTLGLTQDQLYLEAAWLGTQLLANPTNYANQVAVSFALWELTYNAAGSATETPTPTAFLAGSSESSYQTTVNTLLANAKSAVAGGYSGIGWEILTPVAGSSNPSSDGTPQEFLVRTPESSAVVMFSADMLGLLALAFVFRKRLVMPVQ